jgi:hypothetical protein
MFSLYVFRIISIPHLCGAADHKVLFASIRILNGEPELVPERIPSLVNHRVPRFAVVLLRVLVFTLEFLPLPLGLPPSLPFSREAFAFRSLITDPRHAGQ